MSSLNNNNNNNSNNNNNNNSTSGKTEPGLDSFIPDFDIKVENLCENNCPKINMSAILSESSALTQSLGTSSSLSIRSPTMSPTLHTTPNAERSNFTGNKNQSLKQRINNLVIKTLAENSEKDKQNTAIVTNQPHSAATSLSATSPASKIVSEYNSINNNSNNTNNTFMGDTWKIKVLQFTRVISNVSDSLFVTDAILKSAINNEQVVVSVDCEGINLGTKGIITLVEIGTVHGEAFIFDILQCPDIMSEGGLKSLLESNKVIKIIHDCRNDSVNLFVQFKVLLRNVFDTQVIKAAPALLV